MRLVTSFESRLLSILYGLLGKGSIEKTIANMSDTCARQTGLSDSCVELAKAALAQGFTLEIARLGWQKQDYWRGESVVNGRVWERFDESALALEFGPATMDFLQWLTCESCLEHTNIWEPSDDLRSGDRLFLWQAFRQTRATRINPLWWRKQPAFEQHALIRLTFADDFADSKVDISWEAFSDWLSEPLLIVLESLQGELTGLWYDMELKKRKSSSVKLLQSIGASQKAVMEAYLSAIDRCGRRDLSWWILEAATAVLRLNVDPLEWLSCFDFDGTSLSQRQEVYNLSLNLQNGVRKLGEWQDEALATRFVDEKYDASQFWKAQWERRDGDATLAAAKSQIMKTNEYLFKDETT